MCCNYFGPFRHRGCSAYIFLGLPAWRNTVGWMEVRLFMINNLLAFTSKVFQCLRIKLSSVRALGLFDQKSSTHLAFLLLEPYFANFLPKNVFAVLQYVVFFSKSWRYFIERKSFFPNNIKFFNFSSHHRFRETVKFYSFLAGIFLFYGLENVVFSREPVLPSFKILFTDEMDAHLAPLVDWAIL
jgi:hypothetical protein